MAFKSGMDPGKARRVNFSALLGARMMLRLSKFASSSLCGPFTQNDRYLSGRSAIRECGVAIASEFLTGLTPVGGVDTFEVKDREHRLRPGIQRLVIKEGTIFLKSVRRARRAFFMRL
jgi:hypothetical protein